MQLVLLVFNIGINYDLIELDVWLDQVAILYYGYLQELREWNKEHFDKQTSTLYWLAHLQLHVSFVCKQDLVLENLTHIDGPAGIGTPTAV